VVAQLKEARRERRMLDCFEELDRCDEEEVLLSVCGCDELLYGNEHALASYKHIQKCIAHNKMVMLCVSSKEKVKSRS
jgi:hypothetical protein